MKQDIFLPGQNPDASPYSEALRVGDFIFVAGQGPLDPVTGEVRRGTIEDEVRTTLTNIQRLLEQAGATLNDVVKVTVHLADMDDFDRYNAVYREFFPNRPRPVRITTAARLWSGIK